MEAFSLLKYWRGSGGGGGGNAGVDVASNYVRATSGTSTIVTAVARTTEEPDDDGPFFDLEFTVPDEDADAEESHSRRDDEEGQNEEEHNNGTVKMINCLNNDNSEGEEDDGNIRYDDDCEGEEDEEEEFNFTLSSGSSNDRIETNLSLSPSDDLFFKGRLVPINGSGQEEEEDEREGEGDEEEDGLNSNSKVQFPVSLLKSATKFRVFMLGLKKSKSNIAEEKIKEATNGSDTSLNHLSKEQKQSNKSFTVKFKVEEVPIMSLFSKDSKNSSANKSQKLNAEESASDEKRFSKEVMNKYLKKVKPLYIRVSRRYGEKLRFSGQLSLKTSSPVLTTGAVQKPTPVKPATAEKCPAESEVVVAPPANAKTQKEGNFPAGLREVCKHLGKSRSASSAAVAAISSGPAPSRRDDSLLLQHDNIQSAILHCKRSFNASRGQ